MQCLSFPVSQCMSAMITYQPWERTQKNAQNWTADVMMICPTRLASTFFDTRLAVGRLGCIRGHGSVRPTASSIQT